MPEAKEKARIAIDHGQASHILRAAAWMMVALASFTLIAIAGREAAREATTITIMLYRSWMALPIVFIAILISRRGLSQFATRQIGMHGLRSCIHFGAQFSWLYALPLIPLTQLFAIEFTAPLWTALLAPLLLHERLTGWRMLAVGLGFIGILIVVRPGRSEVSVGTLFALLAAVSFAVHYIITKRLMRQNTAFAVIFYMTLFQAVLASVIGAFSFQIPDAFTASWIFVIAACGLSAHFAIARAFSLADAIVVTPMDFLRLPLIALVGVALYAEPLDPLVLTGGALVVIANFINLWSERQRSRS